MRARIARALRTLANRLDPPARPLTLWLDPTANYTTTTGGYATWLTKPTS